MAVTVLVVVVVALEADSGSGGGDESREQVCGDVMTVRLAC